VKRLFFLVILAIIFIGLLLLDLSDTTISIDDTANPKNELTSAIGKTGNSLASATITITMYAVTDE